MPQFVRMQRAMCVRKTVVGQGTYMLAPRSYRLLVSALGFALLASITPNAGAANPPDDLAKFLFLTQLGDTPDNAVVCPSFTWKPIPAALLQSLQVADSRFVRADELVAITVPRAGTPTFFRSMTSECWLMDARSRRSISTSTANGPPTKRLKYGSPLDSGRSYTYSTAGSRRSRR
jgi:hypothetical protein